jgi:K+-sensing histidine kinase KdpD
MKLFGPKPETYFIGKSVFDFIIPEDKPQIQRGINRCIQTSIANQAECSIRIEDGTTRKIKTTSFPLSDKSDIPIALCSFVQERSDEAISSSPSSENVQKAQLYLDLLGHDVSNKLQVILSSTELLREFMTTQTAERLLDNILESVSSCTRLIHGTEILETQASEPMNVACLELVVEEALYSLLRYQDEVSIEANFQVGDATILCDRFVSYLVSSILDNACKHNTREDKHVWVKLVEDENGYLLNISDNGPGIPITNSLTGSSLGNRSTGIGLYVCKVLIEKYQGWMEITDRIENQPDQGTLVKVWFPCHSRDLS